MLVVSHLSGSPSRHKSAAPRQLRPGPPAGQTVCSIFAGYLPHDRAACGKKPGPRHNSATRGGTTVLLVEQNRAGAEARLRGLTSRAAAWAACAMPVCGRRESSTLPRQDVRPDHPGLPALRAAGRHPGLDCLGPSPRPPTRCKSPSSAPASAEVGERLTGGPGLGSGDAVDAAGVVADAGEEALEAADGIGADDAVDGSGVRAAGRSPAGSMTATAGGLPMPRRPDSRCRYA